MRSAVAVLALLLLAAPAAAQVLVPDERAAAQAFADAAARFDTAVDALPEPKFDWDRRCPEVVARVPARRRQAGVRLAMSHGMRVSAGQLERPMDAFRAELAAVQTLDPALIAGREAVRRLGRAWDALPAAGDFCIRLRAWARGGYPKRAGRRAQRELDRFLSGLSKRTLRELDAAAKRMRELGVPAADAERFGGERSGDIWG